jgi:hypothetical protein
VRNSSDTSSEEISQAFCENKPQSPITSPPAALASTLVAGSSLVRVPKSFRHPCCGRQIRPHDVAVDVFDKSTTVALRCPKHHVDSLLVELPARRRRW